jgi:hypothetical protein
MGPIKRQTHWKVAELDDGGIVVTAKQPPSEIQRVAGRDDKDYNHYNVSEAVRVARERYEPWKTIDEPLTADVELEEDGTVTLRGTASGQSEAVEMIQAALDTPGVTRVISYISWPGHRPTDGIPKD